MGYKMRRGARPWLGHALGRETEKKVIVGGSIAEVLAAPEPAEDVARSRSDACKHKATAMFVYSFTCTRRSGHDGDHAAHGMIHGQLMTLARWPKTGARTGAN